VDKNYEAFEKRILSDEMRKLYNDCMEKRKAYKESVADLIELARVNKDSAAYAVLEGAGREAANAYQAALDALQEKKIADAKKSANDTKISAKNIATLLITMIIIGIVLAVFLGVFLTISITRPLGKVVVSANQIAQQDLTALGSLAESIAGGDMSKNLSIQSQELTVSSGDEIGILAHSFNSIIIKLKESGKSIAAMCETLREVISETNTLAKSAVEGKLESRGNASSFKGAFKEIVDGLNLTLEAVASPIGEASSILAKMAGRDLTSRMKGDYKGDFAKIKESVNVAADNLDSALGQVSQATEQVSSASQQISSGSQSLAQGANEQASSLEEVSSSLEEMSSMTKQNAENANQAKNLATEANGNAAQGKQAMQRMSEAIGKIKQSSDETAKIVKTIDEIAMQTNLLALNAAVEAARAGEAGRGFAVVAEEVRNLAQRSAEAAKNTANMIEESVKNAEEGVQISLDVAKAFEAIAGSNAKVDGLIAEIAAASGEQSQGIDQVNNAVAQMDKVTQQNAANSEESASAAEELSSQAEELQNMVAQFALTNRQTGAVLASSAVHRSETAAPPAKVAEKAKHKNGKTAAAGRPPHKEISKAEAEAKIPMDEALLKEF
jgi:methyl-accepting chemotaxis protein